MIRENIKKRKEKMDCFCSIRSPRCRQYMSKWNLRLDDNLVELEGRTLEPETINYSDRSVRYKQQEADWSRDGMNNYLL